MSNSGRGALRSDRRRRSSSVVGLLISVPGPSAHRPALGRL